MRDVSLEGISDKIECPVLICDAEENEFLEGQPLKLKEALGEKGTRVLFTSKDAAQYYCQVGVSAYLNQVVLEWFKDIIKSLE